MKKVRVSTGIFGLWTSGFTHIASGELGVKSLKSQSPRLNTY